MPHNTLRLSGGTIVNETPVLNSVGIASSNRIRFKYDPQGLTLVEKIGGWAKFFASTITAGVVRALWGWQDTNTNQWIGFAADSSTASELGAIQCTVNGSTGLTSATGSIINITPNSFSDQTPGNIFQTAAGNNVIDYLDPIAPSISPTPNVASLYITTPVSVGGIVLGGRAYQLTDLPGGSTIGNGQILATDVLGNPLPAVYTTANPANQPITSVTIVPSTSLTINFGAPAYTVPVGQNVNIYTADNIISGSYIVTASTTSSFTVATNLPSYTFTSGAWDNFGVVPIYKTTINSTIVTVIFPNHGQSVGGDWIIVNPTNVSNQTLYGQYTVQTVTNAWTFTIFAPTAASTTDTQYQNAVPVTSITSVANTSFTLHFSPTPYNYPFGNVANDLVTAGVHILVAGNSAPVGSGTKQTVSANGSGTVTFLNGSASGSAGAGATFSPIGGTVGLVYNIAQTIPPAQSTSLNATFWTLDSWGNDLLACPGNSVAINYPTNPLHYQPIYWWDPTASAGNVQAQAIATGPTVSDGMFVAMPQRQIVAWGSSFSGIIDPLLVRWSDVNNFNTWVAQVANQAGSFRLASGAAIIGGRQTPQQGLLWTDIELWSMTYINQPLVYGFNKIGQGCGLIGRYAHGILNGIVYWMGKTQFFMLSGDGVVAIPCPIWDVAFQDLDLVNVAKITCATNAMFQEIAWYFPVKSGTGENSNYVKLNVSGMIAGQPPLWDFGTLDRSAWIDVSVLQQPIGFSPVHQFIYQHEISPDADGAAMGETFTTGWFSIAEGDQMPFVDQVWSDAYWGYFAQAQNASINVTISGADYPGLAVQTVGPYTVTQSITWISPRMRHRLLSFTVAGTGTGTWWRLGGFRYRWQPDGRF